MAWRAWVVSRGEDQFLVSTVPCKVNVGIIMSSNLRICYQQSGSHVIPRNAANESHYDRILLLKQISILAS